MSSTLSAVLSPVNTQSASLMVALLRIVISASLYTAASNSLQLMPAKPTTASTIGVRVGLGVGIGVGTLVGFVVGAGVGFRVGAGDGAG